MPVRLLLLLMSLLAAPPAAAQPFVHDVGASWSVRQEEGLCLLEQAVRDFGVIRFVGAPRMPLRLELLGHREVFADGAVGLYRVAPPWHPAHPATVELGSTEQRAGSAVLIADPLATRVLMALYDGYETRVEHAAWYGGDAAIRIGNEHLRGQYQAFARCLEDVTSRGWSMYERTRIEYPSDKTALSEADRTRLRLVAEYVLADPAVTRVFVDGHTDDVGPDYANLALSKRRAEQVATFLRSSGVPGERLVVRYHGSKYPVATGDSDAARAENRRTTVRLERDWGGGDVASR